MASSDKSVNLSDIGVKIYEFASAHKKHLLVALEIIGGITLAGGGAALLDFLGVNSLVNLASTLGGAALITAVAVGGTLYALREKTRPLEKRAPNPPKKVIDKPNVEEEPSQAIQFEASGSEEELPLKRDMHLAPRAFLFSKDSLAFSTKMQPNIIYGKEVQVIYQEKTGPILCDKEFEFSKHLNDSTGKPIKISPEDYYVILSSDQFITLQNDKVQGIEWKNYLPWANNPNYCILPSSLIEMIDEENKLEFSYKENKFALYFSETPEIRKIYQKSLVSSYLYPNDVAPLVQDNKALKLGEHDYLFLEEPREYAGVLPQDTIETLIREKKFSLLYPMSKSPHESQFGFVMRDRKYSVAVDARRAWFFIAPQQTTFVEKHGIYAYIEISPDQRVECEIRSNGFSFKVFPGARNVNRLEVKENWETPKDETAPQKKERTAPRKTGNEKGLERKNNGQDVTPSQKREITQTAPAQSQLRNVTLPTKSQAFTNQLDLLSVPPSKKVGKKPNRIGMWIRLEWKSAAPIHSDQRFNFGQRLKDQEKNPIVIQPTDTYVIVSGTLHGEFTEANKKYIALESADVESNKVSIDQILQPKTITKSEQLRTSDYFPMATDQTFYLPSSLLEMSSGKSIQFFLDEMPFTLHLHQSTDPNKFHEYLDNLGKSSRQNLAYGFEKDLHGLDVRKLSNTDDYFFFSSQDRKLTCETRDIGEVEKMVKTSLFEPLSPKKDDYLRTYFEFDQPIDKDKVTLVTEQWHEYRAAWIFIESSLNEAKQYYMEVFPERVREAMLEFAQDSRRLTLRFCKSQT